MKATEIAESIRHTVEMSKLHPNDTESLTCSIGVADINDASSVKQAIAFADEALYHAKGEGRNTVVTYALDR
jgi:diguanylate cyclase (GGDEF)-like protein